jgi:hypothetical protein
MSWSASGPGCPVAAVRSGADLAVLEGAGEYLRAREQVPSLYARPGERPGGEEFRVDVVYADGCRMPW